MLVAVRSRSVGILRKMDHFLTAHLLAQDRFPGGIRTMQLKDTLSLML